MTADSDSRADSDGPGPRVIRFARFGLGTGIGLALLNLLFAVQLHRPRTLQILFLVIALLLAAAFRLSPLRRVQLAFVVVPSVLLFYGFEWKMASARPYDATSAARRGVAFDTRSQWEVIRDARQNGQDAYPPLMPRALLVLDMKQGLDATELSLHTVSKEWGVVVGDKRILTFGGVSNKPTIHCNEGGQYSRYPSDEHGFNNPRGIWDRETIDLAFVGDSFTQAACVLPEESPAGILRRKYPATLNLGMAGNGPLFELAGLEEYLTPKKPKDVLWVYYANDLGDLNVEKQSPLLMRYLEEDGFTQGLAGMQPDIDRSLVELAGRIEKIAPAWPGWLPARQSSPIWFGDLVMGENHSSASAVLRLDRISFALTEKLVVDHAHETPDVPLFKRVLARAKDKVAAWGGKLHFVYMADMFFVARTHAPFEHHYRQIALGAARDVGLPIIDTQPDMFAAPNKTEFTFHPESHCNPTGYAKVAEILGKALSEKRVDEGRGDGAGKNEQ